MTGCGFCGNPLVGGEESYHEACYAESERRIQSDKCERCGRRDLNNPYTCHGCFISNAPYRGYPPRW